MYKRQDEFIIACACDILREKQPDVLLIHPANIDGARHQYGVFHEMVDRAVVDTDRFVQQLMGVQEELGLAEQTNLVAVSYTHLISISEQILQRAALSV